MKKILFPLMSAALLMTACSNDETIETVTDRSGAISFNLATDGLTRGAVTTLSEIQNAKEFYVTAQQSGTTTLFNDEKFTTTDNINWKPQGSYYYPSDDSEIKFYAYYPAISTDAWGISEAASGATVDLTYTNPRFKGVTVNTSISDQKDLVIAYQTGKHSEAGSGKTLVFKHILSQIMIKAKNSNKAYEYEVTGIKINGVMKTGTYIYPSTVTAKGTALPDFSQSTPSWEARDANTNELYASNKDDIFSYTNTWTNPIILNATAASVMNADKGETDNFMLIPQDLTQWTIATTGTAKGAGKYFTVIGGNSANYGAYIALKLKITNRSTKEVICPADGNEGWIAVPIGADNAADDKWEAGKKYVYTLDFSNGGGYIDPTEPVDPGEPLFGAEIKFTIDVDDWTEATVDWPANN